MSATRLLVLGVVRSFGVAHGYQVRRELRTWSADTWANVQPGSIYHALKQMAKEGLLEQIDIEPGGTGPERTGYRLTEDGETEFQILLARSLSEVDGESPRVDVLSTGVTFLTCLPRKRAIGLLQHRITQLEGQHATVTGVLTRGTDWGHPEHVNELYRLWLGMIEASMTWTRGLIERLEAGEYVMADDAPDHFGHCPVVIKLD